MGLRATHRDSGVPPVDRPPDDVSEAGRTEGLGGLCPPRCRRRSGFSGGGHDARHLPVVCVRNPAHTLFLAAGA